MKDSEVINKLRSDVKNLDSLYINHKEYSFNFMRKMHNDENVLMDIYQDALIVLYEKAQDKSFELTCSIQTYLNSVCRNQILNRFKKDSKMVSFSEEFDPTINHKIEEEEEEDDERNALIQMALNNMKDAGGPCYEILKRFFYEKQSMQEIAEKMNYTNAANAKNQKARCQKKLKEAVLKKG